MDTSSTETKEEKCKNETKQHLFDYSLSSTILPQTTVAWSPSRVRPRQTLPVGERFAAASSPAPHLAHIAVNADVYRQQFDIIMDIDFHTSPHAPPPIPTDANQIESVIVDMETDTNIQMKNQVDEDLDKQHDDDDNKTITEYESDRDSDYYTPPPSDDDNDDSDTK